MTAEKDQLGAELQSANRVREREYFRRLGGESGAGAPGRTGQQETSEALPPRSLPFPRFSFRWIFRPIRRKPWRKPPTLRRLSTRD